MGLLENAVAPWLDGLRENMRPSPCGGTLPGEQGFQYCVPEKWSHMLIVSGRLERAGSGNIRQRTGGLRTMRDS